jgi:hypothetical protein
MKKVPNVYFTPNATSQPYPLSVTIHCEMQGVKIYYTLNGQAPNQDDPTTTFLFDPLKPIMKTTEGALIIHAVATYEKMTDSDIGDKSYEIVQPKTAAVRFNPEPQGIVFNRSIQVSLLCDTPNVIIHYTLDNSEPTYNSLIYIGPISVSSTTTITAFADRDDLIQSDIRAATFILKLESAETVRVVAHPVGLLFGGVDLTLLCNTPDSFISVSINNGPVTRSSSASIQPLHLRTSGVNRVRTQCTSDNYQDGPLAENTFFIMGVPPPVLLPSPDVNYTQAISVIAECNCPGCSPVFGTPTELKLAKRYLISAWCSNAFGTSVVQNVTYNLQKMVLPPAQLTPGPGQYLAPQSIKALGGSGHAVLVLQNQSLTSTMPDTISLMYQGTATVKSQVFPIDVEFSLPSEVTESQYELFAPGSLCTPHLQIICYHETTILTTAMSTLSLPSSTFIEITKKQFVDAQRIQQYIMFRVCKLPTQIFVTSYTKRLRDAFLSSYTFFSELGYLLLTGPAVSVKISDGCYKSCNHSEWFSISPTGCHCSNEVSAASTTVFSTISTSGAVLIEGLSFEIKHNELGIDTAVGAGMGFTLKISGINLPTIGGFVRVVSSSVDECNALAADGNYTEQALTDATTSINIVLLAPGPYFICYSFDNGHWDKLDNTTGGGELTTLPRPSRVTSPTILPSKSGVFTEFVTVTIITAVKDCVIRYSLNNTVPWSIYTSSFVLTFGLTRVSATCTAPGYDVSDTSFATFDVRYPSVNGYVLESTTTGMFLSVIGDGLITDNKDVIKIVERDCQEAPYGRSGLLSVQADTASGARRSLHPIDIDAPMNWDPLTVCYGYPNSLRPVGPLEYGRVLSVGMTGIGQCTSAMAAACKGGVCSKVMYQGDAQVSCRCLNGETAPQCGTNSPQTAAPTTLQPTLAPTVAATGTPQTQGQHQQDLLAILLPLLLGIMGTVAGGGYVYLKYFRKKKKHTTLRNTYDDDEEFQPKGLPSITTTNGGPNGNCVTPTSHQKPPPRDPNLPPHLVCPLTHKMYLVPVDAADGYTYEESALVEWLKLKDMSPVTGALLPNKRFEVNEAVKMEVVQWREHQKRIDAPGPMTSSVEEKDSPTLTGGPAGRRRPPVGDVHRNIFDD